MSELATLPVERQILVSNQARNTAATITTDSNNWSEIARMIQDHPDLGVTNIGKMRAVLHSSRVTLELPNAEIPAGAQKIFLFEGQVKSGATKSKEPAPLVIKGSLYETKSYNELRKLAADPEKKAQLEAKGYKLGSNVSKQDLINALEAISGLKIDKTVKTTPTGKVKEVVKKTETPEAKETIVKDEVILSNQPSLEERVTSMELALSNLIFGIHKALSDFIPNAAPITAVSKVISSSTKRQEFVNELKTSFSEDELDTELLKKEASKLKL